MTRIGIDLGTTFTVAAYIDEFGKEVAVMNSDGKTSTPSAVYIDPDGNVIVGEIAKDTSVSEPKSVVIGSKLSMGQNIEFPVRDKKLRPEDVAAAILKKVAQDVENQVGDVESCIITCPAYFDMMAKSKTKEAGEMAGLPVQKVYPESLAAAVAHGFHQTDEEKYILVYDLGGGTFDVTLVQAVPQAGSKTAQLQEITTRGNHRLGGLNFDQCIVAYASHAFVAQHGGALVRKALEAGGIALEDIEKAESRLNDVAVLCQDDEARIQQAEKDGKTVVFATALDLASILAEVGLDEEQVRQMLTDVVIDPRDKPDSHQDLYIKAERTKIHLARIEKTRINISHEGFALDVELTRGTFESLVSAMIHTTMDLLDEILIEKKLEPSGIAEVLLAGSSTKMPLVRSLLEAKFPGRVQSHVQPDLCVAYGAARLVAAEKEDPKPLLACSHSYGVRAKDDKEEEYYIYPLIIKDTHLPCETPRSEDRGAPAWECGRFLAKKEMKNVAVHIYENKAETFDDLWAPEDSRFVGAVTVNLEGERTADQEIYVQLKVEDGSEIAATALDVANNIPVEAVFTLGCSNSGDAAAISKRNEEMKRFLDDTEISG